MNKKEYRLLNGMLLYNGGTGTVTSNPVIPVLEFKLYGDGKQNTYLNYRFANYNQWLKAGGGNLTNYKILLRRKSVNNVHKWNLNVNKVSRWAIICSPSKATNLRNMNKRLYDTGRCELRPDGEWHNITTSTELFTIMSSIEFNELRIHTGKTNRTNRKDNYKRFQTKTLLDAPSLEQLAIKMLMPFSVSLNYWGGEGAPEHSFYGAHCSDYTMISNEVFFLTKASDGRNISDSISPLSYSINQSGH